MANRRTARVRALAKINLSLRILGTRADGFHELQTIFQSVALHDTLVLRVERGAFALRCSDPVCPADRSNLVWQAAERVWRAAGRRGAPSGFAIDLTKRIPMEAGLGGGSSDAAAAVRLVGAWLGVAEGRQRSIGAALGADVPFFFEGGTVLGLDRGDVLFPLVDEPRAWVVLAMPPFGVKTREAYAWWDASHRAKARGGPAVRRASRALVNDFEPLVARRHPEIGRLVRTLMRAGAAHAAMSGSGSTVFGLFTERAAALAAATRVRSRGIRTVVTRLIDRKAYARTARVQFYF